MLFLNTNPNLTLFELSLDPDFQCSHCVSLCRWVCPSTLKASSERQSREQELWLAGAFWRRYLETNCAPAEARLMLITEMPTGIRGWSHWASIHAVFGTMLKEKQKRDKIVAFCLPWVLSSYPIQLSNYTLWETHGRHRSTNRDPSTQRNTHENTVICVLYIRAELCLNPQSEARRKTVTGTRTTKRRE